MRNVFPACLERDIHSKAAYILISAIVTVILMWMLLLFVSVDDANAYSYLSDECHFDTDSIDPITYRFHNVASSVETAFERGVGDWNNTNAPGYFEEAAWTSFDPEIDVEDGYYSKDVYAEMPYRCSGDDTYRGNEVDIRYNIRFNLNSTEKRAVLAHELGHAYGLGHVSTGCHIMTVEHDANGDEIGFLLSCSGDRPSSDDVNGVKSIYNP